MINLSVQPDPDSQKLIRKEIQTYYNPITYSFVSVFSPKEKSISLNVILSQDTSLENAKDFIVTISDVNNRCIRESANLNQFQNYQLKLVFELDSTIFEGPYRVEIIHRTENENFKNYSFKIWYMAFTNTNGRPGLFARIGKYFPGPSRN